ncbi:hypothetical protein SDC9_146969 [bioreactor metagenome]|uniref:Uncharacterized protein n=1 Tax=bioreactor metagenome TaxID=1076179 RepID=A0A645EEC7_9ZZZZ
MSLNPVVIASFMLVTFSTMAFQASVNPVVTFSLMEETFSETVETICPNHSVTLFQAFVTAVVIASLMPFQALAVHSLILFQVFEIASPSLAAAALIASQFCHSVIPKATSPAIAKAANTNGFAGPMKIAIAAFTIAIPVWNAAKVFRTAAKVNTKAATCTIIGPHISTKLETLSTTFVRSIASIFSPSV